MRTLFQPNSVVKSSQRTARTAVVALFIVAGMLFTANYAHAQDDLAALFDQAGESFRPTTDDDVANARAELTERMRHLEQFVRPSSQNGQRWLRYLHWDELKQSLAADGAPKLNALFAAYQRFNRDENGLELKPFRRVAEALERYIHVAQIAQQPDQQKYYRSQLDALEKQLEEYRREPSASAASQIGARIRFLAGLDRQSKLVTAVRREFVRPNAYMEISTALVAEGAEPIDRREPITDCILGVNIRSDAQTTGTVGVASIPSDDKAIVEFMSEGRTRSHNVGSKGPAVIRSNAVTDFTASKRVELTDEEFVATASRSHATTDTHIYSVAKKGGGFGSRIVSNIGWDRARESEHRAEAIAADHAEDRIDRRFNDELNEEIRDARRRYEEEYRRPLARRGALPEHIRFSSDKDSVNLEVAQASHAQLGAPGAPPEAPGGHDMSMRLHDSAVNNFSAVVLGGATATQTKPGEDMKFDVKLPDWMKDAWKKRKTDVTADAADNAPFKQYSLRFRDNRPLTVSFAGGKVELTVHIARLKSGDKTFTNWDVKGIYTPEIANGGIALRRDGDLTMLPADFKGSLSTRQTAERANLEEELNARSAQGRGFPQTVEFEPLNPEDALKNAGLLEFNEFNSDNGWLTIAWDRQNKANSESRSGSRSTPRRR